MTLLYGGLGSDEYRFGAGDGRDEIFDQGSGPYDYGSTDTVLFEDGIEADDLWFSREGDNLQIDVIGTEDRVTIGNWYSEYNGQEIERFETSSGEVLLNTQVQQLVDAMSIFDPPDEGIVTPSQQNQDDVSAVIAASWA